MDNMRHHRIRYTGYGDKLKDPVGALKRLSGVAEVEIDLGTKEVVVQYDLLKCTEADIEKKMAEEGFTLDNSLGQRLKRGWRHFAEDNEQEAMRAEPKPCCSVEEKKKKGPLDEEL
ncbi:MAG: heavy-metal-associated domain-containing protein [Thermodesulfobacteriota bacterium]